MASNLPNTLFGSYPGSSAMQRDATLAQNAYTRFLTQQRGARDLANIDINGTNGLQRLGSSYGRRGLANSGIFRGAQNEYAQGWMNQRQEALNNIYDQLRQTSMSDAGALGQFGYDQTTAAMEKYQQILQTAAQLNDLKPFLGG